MPFKKIIDNLYLGDQFSNSLGKTAKELKISNIYYDIFNEKLQASEVICKNENFVLTNEKIAVKIYDSYDPRDFCAKNIAPAIKFLINNVGPEQVYTHCQQGRSRSASVIFIYLVVSKIIDKPTFEEALKCYIDEFYPFMKVNYGFYNYLECNYPFDEIKTLSNQKWEEM